MSGPQARASSYATALTSVAFGALGQVLLKSGVGHPGPSGLVETLSRAFSAPLVWVGLASYAFSSLLWLVALSRMDLSAAYPLGASGYVVVALASCLMGESVSAWRWLGVVAIVAGVLVVSVRVPDPGGSGGRDR
jgi:drug/metabolite transporter (DMT)-like permease